MKKLFFVWVLMATFVSYVAAEVIIVGHRGSYWGVENTSAAFIKGVTDGGYNYLETDVKVTKDNQYVCWHDDDLERVGHSGVTIAGNTLATLKTKQLTQTRGSVTYTGYLTSIAEYLDICKQYNVLPLIELKWATGINTNDCSKIPGLVQLISDKGFYNTCIILTSMKVCLQYIRQNYPGIKCQYLVYSLTAVKAETLTWCKANGVHLSSGVGSELNSTWVNNFHNAGLEVGVWTVNTSSSFTSYQNMGVDYITTDYLKFEAQTPTIVASPTTLSISAMVGNSASKTFTVSGYNTTANITVTSNNNMFTVSPASLAKTGGTVTVTYTPTAVGTHSATITLKSTGAADKTVNVTGTAKTAPITFTQIWNYSQTSGQSANWATDFTKIRNMDYGSGKLYVITETSKISVINAQTGAYLGDLSTQGLTGGTLTLIDCKVVGTSIVACNLATSTAGPLKVYVWDNDNSHPRVLLNTTDYGGVNRIGDCIGFQGNLTNGKIYFAGGSTTETNKEISYTITNGVCSTTPTVQELIDTGTGQGMKFGISPRIIPDEDGKYWCNGQSYYPSLFSEEGKLICTLKDAAVGSVKSGNAFQAFKFKGTQYGVATTYNEGTPTITAGRAAVFDATNGWADAQKIGEYPSAGLGTTQNTSFSTSLSVAVNGTAGVEFWVLVHNQGVAYFRHGTAPTWNPVPPNPTNDPTITVNPSTMSLTTVEGSTKTGTVTLQGSNLTSNMNLALSGTNANLFSLSASSVDKSGGSVVVTYAPMAVGTHTATLTVSSTGAQSKTVALTGTATPKVILDDNVELTEVWNFSQASGNTANWITNGTQTTQDIAYNNGKLYVLERTAESSKIYIVNAYTGVKTGELNTAACTVGTYALSAIDVLGGKVVASNLATGTPSTLIVYKWDSDTSEPVKMLETTNHADVRVGDKMGVSGTMTNGKIWFGYDSKVFYYTVTNGVAATTPTVINLMKSGTAYPTGATAAVGFEVNSDGSFWVIGKDAYPARFSSTGEWIENFAIAAVGGPVHGTSARFFDFGAKKYAAVATYLNKSATSLAEGCFSLINVTSGIVTEQPVGFYPTNGLGGTRNTSFRSQIRSAIENDVVHIWVHMPFQGCAYFKYDGKVTVGRKTIENSSMLLYNTHETLFVKGIEAINIDLYTLTGQKIRTVANQNEMSILGLQGIYVVVVKDSNNVMRTAKVIVK